MKLAAILSVALVFCFYTPNLYAEIYSWTDENGVKHYSNVTPPQKDEQTGEIQGNTSDVTPPQKAKEIKEIQGNTSDAEPPAETEQIGDTQGKVSVTRTIKRNGEIIKQEQKWIDDFDEWEPDDEDKIFFVMLAIATGDLDAVKQYLSEGGDVNKGFEDEFTLLHVAAAEGHTQIVELLLRKGADINAKIKETGQTALDLAKEGGHQEIIALLRKHGASD